MSTPQAIRTVVGIGASAGGLKALRTFFTRVRPDSGLSFVVVVHLSPEHESHLADLIQPHSNLPVRQVNETTVLEPNHIYLIPPNANINAIDTHLHLSELEQQRAQRAPIDHFFRTLASSWDGRSVGVVLTGTGSDGTLGIKDIKAMGGLVIVQDPNEAEFDGMPQSAIATGMVDLILPVGEIPEALLRVDRTEPRVEIPADGEEVSQQEQALLYRIFALLRARTDRDFSRYKRSTIMRRIARRMQLNYLEDLPAYVEKLRAHSDEARALADDLLVTVTNFFRDPAVFEHLEREIIPRLFLGKGPNESVRLWSVGCATGEEAYSFAILLLEEAQRRDNPPQIQIFASDLHSRSLARAREGFYPGAIESDVSPERISRFFLKETGGYRIRQDVRNLIVFTPHNLLGDPPFSRLDFISCRNLLIYLNRDVQHAVIDLFHYALNRDGILLLGSAETVDSSDLFRVEDKKLCLYRKRNVPVPEPRLPVFPLNRAQSPGKSGFNNGNPAESAPYGALHQRLLERYARPSVLVNAEDRLVHLSANAGRFLLHRGGEPTANIFNLIPDELRLELSGLLQSAREQKLPCHSRPIPIRLDGEVRGVSIHVGPALEADQEGFALVLFEETKWKEPDLETGITEVETTAARAARIDGLESDLDISRDRLRAVIEKYETSQEEMKASNEEMQSANEELRSTMEELETSKEELQSINEELQTLNQENRHKVEEFAQLSSDLHNLLSGTGIATLFLDRNLRIMRFTPRVADLFNIRTTDRGRPLSDLTHRLTYDNLRKDAEDVLARLVPVECEVQDDSGRWYLTRVLPYRSTDDRIEGVVITFVEITRRVKAEADLRESEERYRLLVENAREYAIFMLDAEGRITSWNEGGEHIFGYKGADVVGRPVAILFTPEDRASGLPQVEMRTAIDFGRAPHDRWYVRKDRSRFWASGALEVVYKSDGTVRGFVQVLRDNTERKQADDQLRAANNSLSRANTNLKQFAIAASHDLREPLRTVTSYSQLLVEATRAGRLEEVNLALGFVLEGNEKMGQLLTDLLTYTEITVDDHDLGTLVDLNHVLEQTLGNLRKLIVDSGAVVTSDPLPPVRGRETYFIQLFQNLIDNAIKYRGAQSPRIHISSEKVGVDWRLAVADNGIGINPTYKEQIFEVFKRLHGKQFPGTGFGLAICRRVVERAGGSIWVESTEGTGSTFYIMLPPPRAVTSGRGASGIGQLAVGLPFR